MTNLEKIRLCREIVDQIQRESRRPLCRLHLSRRPFAAADSHLGGAPYVPRQGQIPVDKGGSQLWLCAQINFAQAPRMEGFPSSGLLQIFLEDWHFGDFGLEEGPGLTQDYWRVLFYPEIDPTVTLQECQAKMAVPWEEAKRSNMPRPANSFDLQDIANGQDYLWRCPEVPLKIDFQGVEQEGVNCEDFRFEKLFAQALKARLPEADPREFMPYRLRGGSDEEREALEQIYRRIKGGGCKMGGYPSYLQDDPRLYDPSWARCDALLLQLYDDAYDYPQEEIDERDLYLNGGPLNFVMPGEDLKKGDFSRVLAQWACT